MGAVGIHILIVALIAIAGAQKEQRTPEKTPVVVELWDTPPAAAKVETLEKQKPQAKAVAAKVAKAVPEPPKLVEKPQPPPDIALRQKLEKEQQAEQERQGVKRQEEEERRREEGLAQEAEARRAAGEKERLARAAAAQAGIDKYLRQIRDKIRRNIVEPAGLEGNPEAEVIVRVAIPSGEVLSIKLGRSSEVAAYDTAALRAIERASPLPLPEDPALLMYFRDIRMKIRPRD